MDQRAPDTTPPDSVTVEHNEGEWHVHVLEDGRSRIREFRLEAAASEFADGERIRLGVYRI